MNECCKKELAHLAKWEWKITNIEKDLDRLVDYMYAEELRHWEEGANPEDHIFHAINNVKNYLIGRQNGRKEKSKLK